MKIVAGWTIAAVAALVLLSACGGGGGEERPPSARETPTPELTAGGPAEVEEEEPPGLSDVSFVENLLAKEEDGEWTRGEGLVATLKLFAGELDAAQVLRHPDLIFPEGTGIFKMAYEYLEDGPDEEAKPEIQRLLELLVFSNEQLEAMAGISPPTAGLPGQLALGAARGPAEDCLNFFKGYAVTPAGVGPCLKEKSITIDGKLYRVFSSAPPLPDGGWDLFEFGHADNALLAMNHTVPIYNKLGKMPPVNIVLSVAPGDALAAAWPIAGEPCGVALYTSMQGMSLDDFQQTIAHELAHCFQQETFTAQNQVAYEIVKWREEGLAEYLSNVAYPSNNLEWRLADALEKYELQTTLLDRAYTNFIWFQHLANSIGNDGLFAVIRALPTRGGRGEQEAALANAHPDMAKIYHDFAKALTDQTVEDTGGGKIPYEAPPFPVKIGGPKTPLVRRGVKVFGVVRLRIGMLDENKQASLAFRPLGLVSTSARPPAEMAWSEEVPSSLPDEDCLPESILVVTNTEPDGGFQIDVPRVLDVGPGGLEGEWVVDNDSIRDRIEGYFPETRLDSISGEIRATFRDDGKVEVVYDNFKVAGHSEGDSTLARILGEPDLYTERTITTNARGTTSYRVTSLPPGAGLPPVDFIEFGDFFEAGYLEGSETVEYYQASYELGFGGDPDAIPVDELKKTSEKEPSGTDLFTSLGEFNVLCGGTILLLEDATLRRLGFPD